jgi:DNA-binding transcriptional ArsR family regulator
VASELVDLLSAGIKAVLADVPAASAGRPPTPDLAPAIGAPAPPTATNAPGATVDPRGADPRAPGDAKAHVSGSWTGSVGEDPVQVQVTTAGGLGVARVSASLGSQRANASPVVLITSVPPTGSATDRGSPSSPALGPVLGPKWRSQPATTSGGTQLPGATRARPLTIASPSRLAVDHPANGIIVTGVVISLVWALAALYSRLRRSSLGHQRTRELILRSVSERPGITPSALARTCAMHENTIRYHIRVLEKAGIVCCKQNQRMLHVFLPGEADTESIRVQAALHANTARQLYETVVAEPGIGVARASRAVGVHRTTLHYHARRLERAGIIRVEVAAAGVRLFIK